MCAGIVADVGVSVCSAVVEMISTCVCMCGAVRGMVLVRVGVRVGMGIGVGIGVGRDTTIDTGVVAVVDTSIVDVSAAAEASKSMITVGVIETDVGAGVETVEGGALDEEGTSLPRTLPLDTPPLACPLLWLASSIFLKVPSIVSKVMMRRGDLRGDGGGLFGEGCFSSLGCFSSVFFSIFFSVSGSFFSCSHPVADVG